MKSEQLCQGSGILPILWMGKVWHREVKYYPGSQSEKVAADGIKTPSSLIENLDSKLPLSIISWGTAPGPHLSGFTREHLLPWEIEKHSLESVRGLSVSKGTFIG